MLDEQGNEIVEQQQEKTFVQTDVDRIVAERLAREKGKYADYDDLKTKVTDLESENLSFKELSKAIADGGGINGTPSEQAEYLKEYWGLTTKQAEKMVNDNQPKISDKHEKVLLTVEAEQFVRKSTDDELVKTIDGIFAKPAKLRTDEEEILLVEAKGRYIYIQEANETKEAKEWYESEGQGDFDALMNDEDFKDFAEGRTTSKLITIQKYLKHAHKEKPQSTGSVKSNGATKEKDYYSQTEVDKLSPKDLENPKIWQAVRNSMTKWGK